MTSAAPSGDINVRSTRARSAVIHWRLDRLPIDFEARISVSGWSLLRRTWEQKVVSWENRTTDANDFSGAAVLLIDGLKPSTQYDVQFCAKFPPSTPPPEKKTILLFPDDLGTESPAHGLLTTPEKLPATSSDDAGGAASSSNAAPLPLPPAASGNFSANSASAAEDSSERKGSQTDSEPQPNDIVWSQQLSVSTTSTVVCRPPQQNTAHFKKGGRFDKFCLRWTEPCEGEEKNVKGYTLRYIEQAATSRLGSAFNSWQTLAIDVDQVEYFPEWKIPTQVFPSPMFGHIARLQASVQQHASNPTSNSNEPVTPSRVGGAGDQRLTRRVAQVEIGSNFQHDATYIMQVRAEMPGGEGQDWSKESQPLKTGPLAPISGSMEMQNVTPEGMAVVVTVDLKDTGWSAKEIVRCDVVWRHKGKTDWATETSLDGDYAQETEQIELSSPSNAALTNSSGAAAEGVEGPTKAMFKIEAKEFEKEAARKIYLP